MRSYVICVWLVFASAAAGALPYQIGMGMALENRLDREVNPNYADLRQVGQIFQEIRFHPWTLELELGYQERQSGSGAFQVKTSTTSAGAWGRFNFQEQDRWSPFVSSGVGAYFDKVTSSYLSESDQRRGTRYLFGLGGGISNVFWKYLLLEGEVRASLVQDRRDPMLSLVVRAGVQI